MILKHYANLSFGQTHYRRYGSGSPVIALHASPLSSAFMLPTINALSKHADVVAPDTPGYGQSDPLTQAMLDSSDDLSPYVEWLREFIDGLGFDKVGLYGVATGSQIAISFAERYPERLNYVIMDSAAHFSDKERQEIPLQYFPSISPKADGSHLELAWKMSNGLFNWFPWYAEDEEHRIGNNPSPEMIHAVAQAYIIAGNDYAQAYQRAFNLEDANVILRVRDAQVRVIRWQGSIVKKYSDRFDEFDWPENIRMCECGPTMDERFAAIVSIIKELS
jgi:pimeloyl-ACP methyl ester carboxylesterase